jgi:hypothetical protein
VNAINMGGLKTAKKAAVKQEKPILPDPTGELLPLVAQSIANKKQEVAVKGALEAAREALGQAAFAHACMLYTGRSAKIEDTFQIGTAEGKALITLRNDYKVPDELAVVKGVLGDKAAGILKESFVIKIEAELIPSFILQYVIDELVKVARTADAMLGAGEGTDGPVFQAISVTKKASVDKAFHEQRYSLLSPEQNARLQQVMPCVVSAKYDY